MKDFINIDPALQIGSSNNKKLKAPQMKYGFHNRLRGIGKLTYPIRIFSAAMFSFIILAHNSSQDSSSDYALSIAIILFFWPHISVLAYKYFNSNKKIEFYTGLFDCFFAGAVAYITDFSLVPSFVVITLTLASGMALNGIKQFCLGILGVTAGILIPGFFMGFYYESSDSLIVTILGLGLLFIFFNYFAYMAYSRSVLLKEALKSIKTQKEELEKEKKKSDALLLNILPYETAAELKKSGKAYPKSYEHVTVLFTDFQKFTNIAEKLTPSELVAEIDHCFKEFDRIITNYNIEKIKTIGDAYLCVCGLPSPNKNHAVDIVSAALEIQEFLTRLKSERQKEGKFFFEARIGIHTGPVVAGIVGIKKFAYDIWGDTVNTASRMESSGEVGKVNISHDTFLLVKEHFNCLPRGKVDAKHKGQVDMYFVEKKFEPSINLENFEKAREYILTRLKEELVSDLTYHGYHHTMDVYHSVIRIAHNEGITGEDLMLLKTAALFHDAGFIYQYRNHEDIGCEIAREALPRFNYTSEQIEKICGMIMATKIPQSPQNKLEQVICDADLDYLGRDDFFEIGDTLYHEFKWQQVINDEIQWNKLQMDFLTKHHYFTNSVIEQRNIRKNQHLEEIRKKVEG